MSKTDLTSRLYDFTIEHAPEAIYWVDKDGTIRNVNKAACLMLQYEKDELIGKTVPQVNPNFTSSSFQAHFKELSEKKFYQSEAFQMRKDGLQIPVEVISNIIEVEGEVFACTYIRDIRDKKDIEKILRQNEERWKTGLEILSEGVWDWDIIDDKISFSKQWSKNFGYDENEANQQIEKYEQIVHPQDLERFKVRINDHITGKTDKYESRHRIKDKYGQWRWVRDRGKVINWDNKGKPVRMIGASQDVTEIIDAEKKLRLTQEKLLKSSHQALRDTKDQFHNIFNNSKDAIFIGDPEQNKIVDINPKACELLGYSKEELLKINLTEIIPHQKKSFIEFFSRVKKEKSASTDKLTFRSKNGKSLMAEISASVFSVYGETGILGIVHVITDEEQFERIIGQVVEGAIISPEHDIISNFVAQTAKVLNIRYAGVGWLKKGSDTLVKVHPFWDKDHFIDSFEYDIRNSPCEHVVGGDFQNHERNVKSLFPESQLLERFKKVQSYMAVPISDRDKQPLGHFFLCDDKPLERKNWIENLLRLGALRMRLEAERSEAQRALYEMNLTLEKKVEERTKELVEVNRSLESAIKEVEDLKDKLQAENIYLKEEINLSHNFKEIVSGDKKFKKVLSEIEQVSKTDSTVLILGETGTGKEILTRAIHNISNRKDRPLVKVNCAALPATLIESELFGHEKGAYTGAVGSKQGRFELADGGTLFLDEVGEIPIELQPKLLRALQEGEFERLGGVKTVKVNVRVIAATNRDLETAIEAGEFRSDLYYRLNVFPIKVPPLRERKEDIPLLVNHFIKTYNQKMGKGITSVSQGIMNQFIQYNWPGNVRELENIVERAIIITDGKQLKMGDWLKGHQNPDTNSFKTLEQFEKDYIIKVLEKTSWKVSGKNGAAEILGMKPTTLESRMKKLGIERK